MTTMDVPADPVCGCPIRPLRANRRDRREAARRGLISAPYLNTHRRGCLRAGAATRSDNGRDQDRRDEK